MRRLCRVDISLCPAQSVRSHNSCASAKALRTFRSIEIQVGRLTFYNWRVVRMSGCVGDGSVENTAITILSATPRSKTWDCSRLGDKAVLCCRIHGIESIMFELNHVAVEHPSSQFAISFGNHCSSQLIALRLSLQAGLENLNPIRPSASHNKYSLDFKRTRHLTATRTGHI